MTAAGIYLRYLRIFHRQAGSRLFVLVALFVLMSYVEGVGIALFFPFFGGGSASTQPELIRRIFHALDLGTTPRAVLPVIVIAFLLKGVLQLVALTYQGVLSAGIARSLRRAIVAALGRADYLFVTSTPSGFYANLLTGEVSRNSQAFVHFSRALPPAVNIVVFAAILLVLDWKLTVAAALMGGLCIAGFRLPGRLIRRYSETASGEHGRLAAALVQGLQAFKYLRATASFSSVERQTEGSAQRIAHMERRTGASAALLLSLLQPLMVVFIAGVLWVRLDVDSTRTAALFVVLIFVFRIMNDTFVLQTNWQSFSGLSGSVDLVERSLAELGREVERSGTREFAGLRESLACERVTFGYAADRPVLRDVSLSIPRNAFVAFVGASGAGKSTLADLLVGVLRPTRGRVTVDGADLAGLALDDYRRRVGYVPQDPVVFDDTIANNIGLWSEGAGDRVREAARRAHALAFIEASPRGFETTVGERGIQLSGGQRQRIAIARELFRDPEILVLDEATSELDSESERAIQQSIEELRGHATILVIAHRLSTVRACDRIYVLDAGHLVEEGSYAELLATPGSRFRAMCDLQGLVPQTVAR